jgi:ABC-type transporter Mla subunit MlaD
MGAQDWSVSRSGVRAGVVRARRWVAICATTAVVSGAAGCGGMSTSSQDKTEAEKWADGVCSSISTWRDTVSQARSTLRHPADLSVGTFEDTLRDVVDATRRLVREVGDLGPPDTTAGDQAADQLSNLSEELDKEMAVLKKTIRSDTTSLSEMLANLSTITGALSTMSADTRKTVDELSSLDGAAELRDAFDSSASCRHLRASASPT